MPNVNFYLKKAHEDTGLSLILLQMKYSREKLVYSTGQHIDPNRWSLKKQRLKSGSAVDATGRNFNDYLNTLAEVCEDAYVELLKGGTPTPSMLRERLEAFRSTYFQREQADRIAARRMNFMELLDCYTRGEIKHKGQSMKPNTIKKYVTLKAHILDFEQKKKYSVTFEMINRDFYNKYLSYLETKEQGRTDGKQRKEKIVGLNANSRGKDIALIKAVMNEALDQELTTNVYFKSKKFSVPSSETHAVYLNEAEIEKLIALDLSANKRLDRVRDFFVFACHVGLRFSDFSRVKRENIFIDEDGDQMLRMITEKTGETVVIPCHPNVVAIFDKYKDARNILPEPISNQKFNDYIKDVCRAAKLTERGKLIDDLELELCDCVSSHTARRSFATNLYLSGFPIFEIPRLTGHRSMKAFEKYIKVSQLETARKLKSFTQKKWAAKLLRVVA